MFRRIKEFRRKTMEEYRKGLEESMDDWKKKVLIIHEKAAFLYYLEDMELLPDKGMCLIRGDWVRGSAQEGTRLLFLSGEGEVIARVRVLTAPEEREEKKRRMEPEKRNQFKVEITHLHGKSLEELDLETYLYYARRAVLTISLIVDDEKWTAGLL